jgi:hypothetical protein
MRLLAASDDLPVEPRFDGDPKFAAGVVKIDQHRRLNRSIYLNLIRGGLDTGWSICPLVWLTRRKQSAAVSNERSQSRDRGPAARR